jgi:hypothetical protein
MLHRFTNVLDRHRIMNFGRLQLNPGEPAPTDHADVVGTAFVESLADDRAHVHILAIAALACDDEEHRSWQLTQLEVQANLTTVRQREDLSFVVADLAERQKLHVVDPHLLYTRQY